MRDYHCSESGQSADYESDDDSNEDSSDETDDKKGEDERGVVDIDQLNAGLAGSTNVMLTDVWSTTVFSTNIQDVKPDINQINNAITILHTKLKLDNIKEPKTY